MRVPTGSSGKRAARAVSLASASSNLPAFISVAAASNSGSREAAWTAERSARQASSSRPALRNSAASRNQPLATVGCCCVSASSAAMAAPGRPASLAACASSHSTMGGRRAPPAIASSRAQASSARPRRRSACAATNSAGGRPGICTSAASATPSAAAGSASIRPAAASSAARSAASRAAGCPGAIGLALFINYPASAARHIMCRFCGGCNACWSGPVGLGLLVRACWSAPVGPAHAANAKKDVDSLLQSRIFPQRTCVRNDAVRGKYQDRMRRASAWHGQRALSAHGPRVFRKLRNRRRTDPGDGTVQAVLTAAKGRIAGTNARSHYRPEYPREPTL